MDRTFSVVARVDCCVPWQGNLLFSNNFRGILLHYSEKCLTLPVHVVRGGPMWAEGRGADIFFESVYHSALS